MIMRRSLDIAIHTPEILETILLFLDERSLLTSAQRVCRYWHDIISTSPSLQKHLFFQPDWDAKNRHVSELLSQAFPFWFPHGTTELDHLGDTPVDTIQQRGFKRSDNPFKTLPMALPHKNASFMHRNASWRRMLVQQPPIPELAAFSVFNGNRVNSFSGPIWVSAIANPFVENEYLKIFNSMMTPSGPLNMGTFYDCTVTFQGHSPQEWIILWNCGESNVPPGTKDYTFDQEAKEKLNQALENYGMVLVIQLQTAGGCTPSSYLWTPGKKFVYNTDWVEVMGFGALEEDDTEKTPRPRTTDSATWVDKGSLRSLCSRCICM